MGEPLSDSVTHKRAYAHRKSTAIWRFFRTLKHFCNFNLSNHLSIRLFYILIHLEA